MTIWEWLNNNSLIFWGAITIMVVAPTIAHYWYKAHRAGLDYELKRQMIERGMSTGEIEDVLRASSDGEEKGEEEATEAREQKKG